MPMVGGKKFPYTEKGKNEARKETMKMGKASNKKSEGGAFAPGYNKSRDIKSGKTYEAGMKKKLSASEKRYAKQDQNSAKRAAVRNRLSKLGQWSGKK